MLKHQRQGLNDCILATIAMLSDTPLCVIHKCVYSTFKKPWTECIGVDSAIKVMRRFTPELAEKYKIFEERVKISSRSVELVEIPQRGIGIMSIRWTKLNGTFANRRHLVAFENGMVYDPGLEKPMKIDDYEIILVEGFGVVEGIIKL